MHAVAVELGAYAAPYERRPEPDDDPAIMRRCVKIGACPICGDPDPAGDLLCGGRECSRRFDGLPWQWQTELYDYAVQLQNEGQPLGSMAPLSQWGEPDL